MYLYTTNYQSLVTGYVKTTSTTVSIRQTFNLHNAYHSLCRCHTPFIQQTRGTSLVLLSKVMPLHVVNNDNGDLAN